MHHLSSAFGKLARAEEHCDALETSVKAIKKTNFARLVPEYDAQARENRWRFYWAIEEPLSQLSPIIGDVLSNCLAALDHTLYALTRSDDRNLYWPISRTSHDWDSARGRLKPFLSPDIITEIEGYQPSMRPDRRFLRALLDLHTLAGIDKHRRFVFFGWRLYAASLTYPLVESIDFSFDAVEPGAVCAVLPGDEVHVKIQAHVDITFGERGIQHRPVALEIRGIVNTVHRVLTHFNNLSLK